jgi:DNA modification methylase
MSKNPALYGTDLFGDPIKPTTLSGKLADSFVHPPESVLNTAREFWQNRKRQWIKLGIRGELGRFDNCLSFSDQSGNIDFYAQKRKLEKELGKKLTTEQATIELLARGAIQTVGGNKSERIAGKKSPRSIPGGGGPKSVMRDKAQRYTKAYQIQSWIKENDPTNAQGKQTGSSIFDPVLCELMYRWFCPPGGHIFDPFAGEATKGIVATYLGYDYTGIELRQEQVDANNVQARAIGVEPEWICADSAKIPDYVPKLEQFDFVWTSPPYYDLEIYSQSEKDGSAFETYDKFMAWYKKIFAACVRRMHPNRFLGVKVGEIRDERGAYRNFVGDNIRIFRELGLEYYNEIILITPRGSLPIRIPKQFQTSRKVGRTHQNVLLFWKGDCREIKNHFRDLKIQ